MFLTERREPGGVPGGGRIGQLPLDIRSPCERLGETLAEAQVVLPYF